MPLASEKKALRVIAVLVAPSLMCAACGGCVSNGNGNDDNGPNGTPVEISFDAVVPDSGPVSGGTEVRLEGRGFLEEVAESAAIASLHTAVRFGDGPAQGVEVISDTIIRVLTPPGILGSFDVHVENPNGTATCSGCFEYTDEEEPVEPVFEVEIDRVSPVRGPAAGGTRTRIEGKGFLFGFAELGEDVRDRTAVLFGDNTAVDFDVVDDRVINVVAPPGNVGARDVRVQNPNGEALCEGCFHYFVPLRAHGIQPASSPASGGTMITLTGAGFTEDTLVRVGDRSAISTLLVDEGTLSFVAPPAPEIGAVNVEVLNAYGRDTLRRGLTYYVEPRLIAVEPPLGSHTGGTEVRLVGEGLVGADAVTFGGAPASDIRVDGDDVVVTSPAGEAGSVVGVAVSHERGTAWLPNSFAFIDKARRDVHLLSVVPAFGSLEGGGQAVLVGTGMDHGEAQVRFGEEDAEVVSYRDANQLVVTVPPASSGPGAVDVQVRNARGGAILEEGYRYEQVMRLDSVSPGFGPADGGTRVTLSGAGFQAGDKVRIGALSVSSLTFVDDSTLEAVTPPGSAGPADVVVIRGEGAKRREAALRDGFHYEEPLSLAQVDPERGSQAGGTYVFLYGGGFTDDVEVSFGGIPATIEDRLGHGVLAVRSPPGSIGLVDVSARLGEEEAVRRSAFQYYDPTSVRGGASGGPVAGTLNVTVLDAFSGAPLPDTHVMLGVDPDTPFQGETDLRGQITFSDPSLVKPVQVTATRAGHESVTVVRIDARDLTVFLTPNEGEAMDMPPPAPMAFINPRPGNGSVCGFKLPPNRELASNQWEEARVWATPRTVTSLPPFRAPPPSHRVTTDCGEFGLASRPGSVALYAKYGVVTQETDMISGQIIEDFEPLIMGITRGIEVPAISPPTCTVDRACPTGFTCDGEENLDPSNPASFRWCLCNSDAACGEGKICNLAGGCQEPISADIVLNMHLDREVPIHLVNPPAPPDGSERVDGTYAYLELGSEGVLFVGETMNFGQSSFLMEGFPRLPGDGFVFLNMSTAGGGYPLSLFFRREIGDLDSGVSIGPMQPMTRTISPAGGVLSGDRIEWTYHGEPRPDVVMIQISEPGFIPLPVWQIIVPGTESSVVVPGPVRESLADYALLEILIVTALSPRFEFDYFSYRQLGLGAWNSFTQDAEYFSVP